MTDFIFLLIAVQNLLPQSMNWQSDVLINDFPDMHFQFLLWVIGDKNCRAELAKRLCDSYQVLSACETFSCREACTDEFSSQKRTHDPSAVACPSSHTVTVAVTSVQTSRVVH